MLWRTLSRVLARRAVLLLRRRLACVLPRSAAMLLRRRLARVLARSAAMLDGVAAGGLARVATGCAAGLACKVDGSDVQLAVSRGCSTVVGALTCMRSDSEPETANE